MPRYMVQRTFPEGLQIPVANGGAAVCATVVERNAEEGVTWVHSYVSADKRTTFCVYDAPNPEAVRKTANRPRGLGALGGSRLQLAGRGAGRGRNARGDRGQLGHGAGGAPPGRAQLM